MKSLSAPQAGRHTPFGGPAVRKRVVRCHAANLQGNALTRRDAVSGAALLAAALVQAGPARADSSTRGRGADREENKRLCDEGCTAKLEGEQRVTTPSGLEYQDLVVGTGQSPVVGYQVVVNYVAMTPAGRVFDSSLDKGSPYDIRVGTGQVIPGLDEGLLTMKSGGVRRLYIPGSLAFPKGVKAAAGRPSVPPSSPVVFDVQLLYIPGLEDE